MREEDAATVSNIIKALDNITVNYNIKTYGEAYYNWL